MTNFQIYLSIGIPAFLILILANAASIFLLVGKVRSRLDRMVSRTDGMVSRFDRIDANLRQFFSIIGAHSEAIETLKKRYQ